MSLPDRHESRIHSVMDVGLCEVSLMGTCALKAHSRGAASGERPIFISGFTEAFV